MTDVARIPLRRHDGSVRAWATVDPADFEWLSRWRWSYRSADGYASRVECRRVDGAKRQRTYLMHRVILGLAHGDPREGDHQNFNRLDNRRVNLRVLTKRANRRHVRTVKGCARLLPSGRWYAYAKSRDGLQVGLGTYATEAEARAVSLSYRNTQE